MTRRERLERKVEQREAWGTGRRQKAAAVHAYTERYRGDVAFNTQPGHFPERARVIRMEDRAHEDLKMAQHHDTKAAGLEAQLDRSVFSDDADAIEQLKARIAEHEVKRDQMKRINALFKKKDTAGLAALGLDLDRLTAQLAEAGPYWGSKPHLPYELTNLGARIRADLERITDIQQRQDRAQKAEARGGVLIEGGADSEYVRVTFADKPDRAILDALKAAGFRWGAGHWIGERAKLPAGIAEG